MALALAGMLIPLAGLRAQGVTLHGSDTLAVVGARVITAAEFAGRYREKLLSVGFTDNPSARAGYLTNLVDDEILLAYGGVRFASKVGQLAGNHFITITSPLDDLPKLGKMALWEGAKPIRFALA